MPSELGRRVKLLISGLACLSRALEEMALVTVPPDFVIDEALRQMIDSRRDVR